MPKLVTVRRPEEVRSQAREYVKSYILFPSGLVGLMCVIGGVGGLGYQLIASDAYTWDTFYESSALIVLGVLLGLAQTRYQQYLFREFPEVLAARMRSASVKQAGRQAGKAKKEPEPLTIRHRGRGFVPIAYTAGMSLLFGGAIVAAVYGQVNPVPALLLPWAGFYWARLFFWRKLVR
jgi:hypothetical protein